MKKELVKGSNGLKLSNEIEGYVNRYRDDNGQVQLAKITVAHCYHT